MGRLLAPVVALCAAASVAAAAAPPQRPPPDSALLRRHLPVLVLHPQERFPPVAVDAFLAASDRLVRRADGSFSAAEPGETPTRLDVRDCSVATGPPAVDCYAPLATGPPTVYGAVHHRPGRIVLQYWMFSPADLWSPVIPAAEDAWQAHEGDWEHVAVVLDGAGKPLQAGYAQHCRGVRIPWARVPRQRGTQRPVVYVALGSHASYPTPGIHLTEARCWPDPDIVLRVIHALGYELVDHAGAGVRVTTPRLVRLTATSPEWVAFGGTWGEDQYVRLGDVTFKEGAGPIGPTHKREWRNPAGTIASWPLAP